MSVQSVTAPMMLDTTGQALVTALNNLTAATQPTNVYVDIPFAIPAGGWSAESPYTYTWQNSHVTPECAVTVYFKDGAEDTEIMYLAYEKTVGGINFTAPSLPTENIPLIARILNADATTIISVPDATLVASEAVSGAANVEEALGILEDGVSANADDIDDLENAVGTVPSGKTLQGQVDDIGTVMGTVPSGKTLQGQADTNKGLIDLLPYIGDATRNNRNAAFHNSIYRGKCLGTSVSAAQYEQISAGTFDDMFVGDYWTMGNQDWVICDFDYYYRCGSTDITKHHVVLMPRTAMSIPEDTALYGLTNQKLEFDSGESATAKKWNLTNSTEGGYKFSWMRQTIMRAANTIVLGLFGSAHVEPITVLYPDPAVSGDGPASNWAWFDQAAGNDKEKSICDLLNETQVYGQQVWGQGSAFGNIGYEIGIDKWQFAIFALDRGFANIRASWWLRSVSSATNAAGVSNYGRASNAGASDALGVRPRFLLVG